MRDLYTELLEERFSPEIDKAYRVDEEEGRCSFQSSTEEEDKMISRIEPKIFLQGIGSKI